MKKFLCTILASIFFFSAFAQTINWKRTPGKTFVFEINNKEALKLLKSLPKDSAVLKMLHTPVASFTGTWENKPSRGHFIFADIYENKVGYQYAPVIPYQVFLFKEYGNLSIQVLDSAGNIVSNAKVKLNRTRIDFDKKSNTYTIDDWSSKTERLLTVEFRKFRTVFNLNKHLVYPSWYNNYNGSSYKPEFYSYMLTDKNKYKPHETIRFKSYALSGNRRPIKKELELWLGTEKYGKYKKIKSVVPYNPGGFAGEFTLDDSLKLTLDKNYPLQLRDKTGRIAASTSFRYEDYQLFDNKLQIKLQSVNQFSPDTNKLEIKATDANGLLLKDVAVAVCIKRKDVLNAYADILQLPDTLMYKRITLDNDKPTVMDIPPGIFKQSDCNYDVEVIALTFENQRMEQRQSATFFSAHYNIVTTTKNDSVCFSFYDLGKEKSISAQLSYDDGKIKKQIQLPYTEKFNQAIAAYHIQPDDYPVKKIITPNDIDAGLDVTGGIIGDSFSVHINNPLQLNISWYIYRGGELLEKGTGKTMDYGYDHVDMETAHYVEMFYTIGKDARMLRRVFVPKENFLSVQIRAATFGHLCLWYKTFLHSAPFPYLHGRSRNPLFCLFLFPAVRHRDKCTTKYLVVMDY
jgi:hypothetical protein